MSAQASADDRARLEAAEWFARLNSRTITTAALMDFREWRAEAGNAAAWAEQDAVWKAAAKLQNDPEIGAAVEAALNRPSKRAGPFAWLTSPPPPIRLAVFAGLGACALIAAWSLASARIGETYRSGLGEQRIVRLEDGSQVRLDTDTLLRVHLDKASRRLELVRGQAFFDVAHDASRPFTVRADGTEVRALGTRFDVRRDAGEVRITLVEGKVAVRKARGDGRWTMTPGEQLRVSEAAGPIEPSIERIDTAAATSWTIGRLTFRATPLTQAIAEVNRYDRRKISLEAGDLGARPINGEFESGDTEAFVAAVADLMGLEIDRRGDAAIVLRRPDGRAG